MACNASEADKCDSCFNFGTGSIMARGLNTAITPNNCQSYLGLEVPNCKYYSGTDTANQIERTFETCQICNKQYLNWEQDIKIAICSDTPATGCSKVDNCLTVVCFTDNYVTTHGCRMCKQNYYGTSFDATNNTGSGECVKGNSIANCDLIKQTAATTWQCYTCKKDYAVAYSQLACVSYGADTNCRV